MSGTIDRQIANLEGAAALPRKNGEIIFEAPWQRRAVGMVATLCNQGLCTWDKFRDRLIAEVSTTDRKAQQGNPISAYYERWLAAFEKVLVEKGVLSKEEIESRIKGGN